MGAVAGGILSPENNPARRQQPTASAPREAFSRDRIVVLLAGSGSRRGLVAVVVLVYLSVTCVSVCLYVCVIDM